MSHLSTAPVSHASVTKHADTSAHKTQKSFKTDRRDRPKHSGKIHSGPKKGGAGGKGVWGKPGDEIKGEYEVDSNDPNFDDSDSVDLIDYSPSDSSTLKFASSIADFTKFKSEIKAATKEYLVSNDEKQFMAVVKALDMTVFHQDLPYIIIKTSFDYSADDRTRLSNLLSHLHKAGFVTFLQMGAGVTKLYNNLHDIISTDCPLASSYLREITQFAVAGGMLDSALVETLEKNFALLSDADKVNQLKQKIKAIVAEYFRSEDEADAVQSFKELNADYLSFEIVKCMISSSLDSTNRVREGTSLFLANQSGSLLTPSAIERGFSMMVERVDDLVLDVPNILKLLSMFIARAVSDEVLAPSFLLRQDLTSQDLGSRVLAQAQSLLNQNKASSALLYCWDDLEAEEHPEKQQA